MNRERKLEIGTVDGLFCDENDIEMSDVGDMYLIKAAENLEINSKVEPLFDEESDVYLSAAAEKYEREMKQEIKRVPPSMLHLLRDSDTRINKRRLVAKVRLRNKEIGQHKAGYVSEYFFYVEEWPAYAIEILFAKDFVYPQRNKLAAFFWGNGLREGDIAVNIFKFYNKHWSGTLLWKQRFEAFEGIFKYYQNNPTVHMYYFYYDIRTNKTIFLNGQKK